MANRWKGNFIVATEASSSGTAYTGKANGAWSLNNQLQQKQANLWARAVSIPSPPTGLTAAGGNNQAVISFTAPTDTGGLSIINYTATSSPGSFTGTSASSPITVTGLTNGTAYTFTVTATNIMGTSASSSASNSVTPVGTALAVSSTLSPYIYAYSWSSGFGGKYANPSTIPSANANSCVFSNNSSYLVLTYGASPWIIVYPWASSFGTKYANPSTALANEQSNVKFNAADNVIITATPNATASVPCLNAYSWSSSGFGTKYSNVSGLFNIGSRGVNFNATGTAVVLCQDSTPFIAAYAWSNGFSTKYANPATLPSSLGRLITFNSTANTVFETTLNSPGINAYTWTDGSGFGTKYANPATLPVGNSFGLGVSPSDLDVAVGHSGGTFISVYAWSAGFGSKYASPAILPIASCQGVSFSRTGNDIALVTNDTPYVMGYPWSAGFGSKYADPTTLPSASVTYSLSFSS